MVWVVSFRVKGGRKIRFARFETKEAAYTFSAESGHWNNRVPLAIYSEDARRLQQEERIARAKRLGLVPEVRW